MNINLFDILILAALSQGFLLGFVLIFSKFFRGTNNKYLAACIILISVIGMNEWLSNWDFDERYYFIDFFGDDTPWILLFYVPLFFYFLKSTQHPFGKSKWRYALVAPFAIFLILNIYINLDVDFHYYSIPQVESFMNMVYTLEFFTALSYSIILCLLAYRIIIKSDQNSSNKSWLKRIWTITSLLILLWVIVVFTPFSLFGGNRTLDYTLWLGISCFIFWVIYKGLFQFKLAQDQSAIHNILESQATPQIATQESTAKETLSSSPSFTEDNAYFKKLEQLIQEEHIYRNPDLSRDIIAERLGISQGYLSQVVNTVTGKNFTTYVNSYRVKSVKKMLKDPAFDQYSLLAIGMEAGFKSKSAFYTTFKKETGMTPSNFKAQEGVSRNN